MTTNVRRLCARRNLQPMILGFVVVLFMLALIIPRAGRNVKAANETASNQPPVAVDDFYTASEDQVLVVDYPGLFANDYDPDYDHFLAHYVIPARHGTVNIVPNQGGFTYAPNANFNGTDTFTYRLREIGTGIASNMATVTITVLSVNDPPIAHDDQLRVAQNSGATSVDVLANDTFIPDTGETLTINDVSQPAHGVTTLNAGNVRYTPTASFNGQDAFTYSISDGNGGTDTANVNVMVMPPPTARARFSSAAYNVTEGCVPATLTVVLENAPVDGGAVTVDYVVTGGTASQKSDYTYSAGTLHAAAPISAASISGRLSFAAGETSRQIELLIGDDGYAEGTETVTVALANPVGAYLSDPATATLNIQDNETIDLLSNPIDDTSTFVCQHYHDFLHRQSDAAGQAFWTNEITMCGADSGCIDQKRHNVSAAFFLAIEFQETAYFVDRLYEACLSRPPVYEELLSDIQRIGNGVVVGVSGWEHQLEINKQEFAEEFVGRAEFLKRYPMGMSAESYADEMFEYAGVTWRTYAEWHAAVEAYGTGDTVGRARAMRKAMESASIFRHYFNRGFVLAQYFGYLRRDPPDPPDTDWAGFAFWLAKLDAFSRPDEDVTSADVAFGRISRAEMITAFIVSIEYRKRFGRP